MCMHQVCTDMQDHLSTAAEKDAWEDTLDALVRRNKGIDANASRAEVLKYEVCDSWPSQSQHTKLSLVNFNVTDKGTWWKGYPLNCDTQPSARDLVASGLGTETNMQ